MFTRWVADFAGRALVVVFGYLLGQTLVGSLLFAVGMSAIQPNLSVSGLLWPAASALVLAVVLAPVVARVGASHLRHALIWGALIFLNTASVLIEGAIFAPTLVAHPAALAFQQLVASMVAAVLLTRLFAGPDSRTTPGFPRRSALSWTWRFLLATAGYLLFYLVFGALNYRLVTQPYYVAHGAHLVVPAVGSVFLAEGVRAPLIVLSLLPLLITAGGSRRDLVLLSGYLLFMVGGVVPLLLQAGTLAPFLLLASGWEILFQNMATGAMIALLLGRHEPSLQPERSLSLLVSS